MQISLQLQFQAVLDLEIQLVEDASLRPMDPQWFFSFCNSLVLSLFCSVV